MSSSLGPGPQHTLNVRGVWWRRRVMTISLFCPPEQGHQVGGVPVLIFQNDTLTRWKVPNHLNKSLLLVKKDRAWDEAGCWCCVWHWRFMEGMSQLDHDTPPHPLANLHEPRLCLISWFDYCLWFWTGQMTCPQRWTSLFPRSPPPTGRSCCSSRTNVKV